jgi:hypothetical protein
LSAFSAIGHRWDKKEQTLCSLTLMPYFHTTAVFEARSSSAEEAEQRAVALFAAANNQHIYYYEHDTSEESGPSSPSGARYFTIVADFDVEARNEEHASDLIEHGLDAVSLDNLQYIAHGLTEGEQRVHLEQHSPREQTRRPEHNADERRTAQEGHGDRRRRPRGRGRGRPAGREPRAVETRDSQLEPSYRPTPVAEPTAAPVAQQPTAAPAETHDARLIQDPTVSDTLAQAIPVKAPLDFTHETSEPEQLPPPQRSSSLMRVTLSVVIRASELAVPTNGSNLPAGQELTTLATDEARRRHPDLPADTTPVCETTALPWGDTIFTLTWHYDVPVPSAGEAV